MTRSLAPHPPPPHPYALTTPTTNPPKLTPEATFTREKLRGILTSMMTGGAAGGLNLGLAALGLSPVTSAFVGLYLFGSLFGYVADVMLAKETFRIPQGYRGLPGPYHGPVPYTDVLVRTRWLLRSFVGKQFFRFFITVLIDSLVGIAMLNALIEYMDARDFLPDFRFRDTLAAGGISIFTFLLYNNILRFDWAYNDEEDHLMNIIILMTSTVVLIVFSVASQRAPSKKGDDATRGQQQPAEQNTVQRAFVEAIRVLRDSSDDAGGGRADA